MTLFLLAACGQKGQLYLPGPAKTDMPAVKAEQVESPPTTTADETAEVGNKKDKNN
ncbi:MAG: lipoprotein [Gammaproteobacteria bacterium]|nr:lipoprotein [Gammaproteobacteria bacterium]